MDQKESWNAGVEHPLQSWEWGEFRGRRQTIDRLDGMLVIWTRVPYTNLMFGYIPMGKVPSDFEIEELKSLGRKRNAVGIRIEPETANTKEWEVLNKLRPTRGLFKAKTLVMNLDADENEIFGKMHPKARYNIRLAERRGVVVSEDNSEEAFAAYLELMFSGTVKRQSIHMHDENYHRQMWEQLKRTGMASLWVAKYHNQILAADIIFRFKKRIFYAYGATALVHRELMAPSLLLWGVARWGKQIGMNKFDLWGIEDGKGFSRFKEQFGGDPVMLPGSFDVIVNKWLYPIFRLTEEARWQLMHRSK